MNASSVPPMPLKPKPKPKRRAFVTQDGNAIPHGKPAGALCYGEALPIAGRSMALDARPRPDRRSVTFDGAMPSPKN